MESYRNSPRGPGARALPRLALLAALVLPAAACDRGLLEVEDPDVTRPEALLDKANLAQVRNTVISDFGGAFGGQGQTNGLVINAGMLADEFWHSGTFGTNHEIDARSITENNSAVATMVRNLYRALRSAEFARSAYAQNDPTSADNALVTSLAGYTYLFFAENFCSAVPFSVTSDPNSLTYGAPESTAQIYERAVKAFDEALRIAVAAKSVPQQNLALIGKARALLDLNRYAEAATLVKDVPTGFVYSIEFSDNTTRENNGIWGLNWNRREIAMSSAEGGNGIAFRVGNTTTQNSAVWTDPRTPWSFRNGATDPNSRHFFQNRYPVQGTPIPLATGVEARLIEAEAALNRGQSASYVATLNALRTGSGSLLTAMGVTPPSGGFPALATLSDPGSAGARVNQFFEERARWLFGTGQRLSDLRRLVRQYGRSTESVFPTGAYLRPATDGTNRREGDYGKDVNFSPTFDERNNEQFNSAQGQCVTTQA